MILDQLALFLKASTWILLQM